MIHSKWQKMWCTLAAAVTLLAYSGAWAKDALMASVDEDLFVFEANGNPLSPATYAIGTLKIYLVVVGTEWPETLSTITLDLAVKTGKDKPATKYPVPIRLRQVGGDLTLDPVAPNFSVTGAAWTDHSDIGITVPEDIRNNENLNADGTELVGNLQIDNTNATTKFDTVTTVRIFAKLVYPDEIACLKTATFVSNPPLSRNYSTPAGGLDFVYGYKQNGSFTWNTTSGPPERDNVLVVNTCAQEQSYDVKIGIASGFQIPPNGNVVQSYVSLVANAADLPLTDPYLELKNALIAPSDYPEPGTEEGRGLCVVTNTLQGMYSQWLTAKVELIETGFTSPAGMPLAGSKFSTFTSDIYENDSACATPYVPAVTQGTADVYVNSSSCVIGGDIKSCSP